MEDDIKIDLKELCDLNGMDLARNRHPEEPS